MQTLNAKPETPSPKPKPKPHTRLSGIGTQVVLVNELREELLKANPTAQEPEPKGS